MVSRMILIKIDMILNGVESHKTRTSPLHSCSSLLNGSRESFTLVLVCLVPGGVCTLWMRLQIAALGALAYNPRL